MKYLLIIPLMAVLSGCSSVARQEPVCTGEAMIGGVPATVDIYAIRKAGEQTQYKSGYPFNWRWVSRNTFSSTTCR